MNELLEALADESSAVSPEIALTAALLPDGRIERRVRVALHLCLERAEGLRQLLAELDVLAVHLCQHHDTATGSALLAVADSIRSEVDGG
jgi:hypothetical protein